MSFRRLGVMLDQSRNGVMTVDSVKRYMDIMADIGYNCLMLYTEDTYEVENQPYFGLGRGRYTQNELKELDNYAEVKGIELIPCIQTLAHLKAIFRWKDYAQIGDCDDILLCEDEGTYKLIDDMFCTLQKCFKSRIVNIGMDEAFMLGRGKYQDKNGFKNKFDILLTHLNKVSEIAEKYGFKIIMWGDMFFRIMNATGGGNYVGDKEIPQEVKDMIPHNVDLIYWDYYSQDKENYDKKIVAHNKVKDGIWFAGGIYTWVGFAPHNAFSMKANKAAFTSCTENGVQDAVLTLWGDNGAECSRFTALPCLYYSSEIAKGNCDLDSIKQGFEEKFGVSFDDFMLLDLPNTPNDAEGIINADKTLLYSDPFIGLFDTLVKPEFGAQFGKAAERLENIENKGDYAVLFDSLAKLCRVLELKCDLGLRTRKAYEENDMAALKKLVDDYAETLSRLESFYTAYEKQWMWENKPHGFDISDIRLGGLIRRVAHCKARLESFVKGEIAKIEELEEPLLDIECRKGENLGLMAYNSWEKTVSSNKIIGL